MVMNTVDDKRCYTYARGVISENVSSRLTFAVVYFLNVSTDYALNYFMIYVVVD